MPNTSSVTGRHTEGHGGRCMRREGVAAAYDRWAPVYDVVFGPVFRIGRHEAISAARRVGGRILEVGVGTGLSLGGYGRDSRIVGVDISATMLDRARARVRALGLDHVESLEVADAEGLPFADGAFDVVVAQYVVTAIPDPERALDEFVRVLRPGGEIVLTSRIGAEAGTRAVVERLLMPLTSRLGWRTQFPWARYERWAAGRAGAVALLERRPLPPLGHFSLIRFSRLHGPAAAPARTDHPDRKDNP